MAVHDPWSSAKSSLCTLPHTLVLGFLLLLIAHQAPLIAALGVAITALSVAGAFGIGRLIFQNGFLSGFLGFQPQGFVDAWAPLFVLLPVLLRLGRHHSWHQPKWLRRILPKVSFSH